MKSRANKRFWEAFKKLPLSIQKRTKINYRIWKKDPCHPSIHFKPVIPGKFIYSVRIGISWRALGVKQGNCMIWFWIGSHEYYNSLVSQLRRQ